MSLLALRDVYTGIIEGIIPSSVGSLLRCDQHGHCKADYKGLKLPAAVNCFVQRYNLRAKSVHIT